MGKSPGQKPDNGAREAGKCSMLHYKGKAVAVEEESLVKVSPDCIRADDGSLDR